MPNKYRFFNTSMISLLLIFLFLMSSCAALPSKHISRVDKSSQISDGSSSIAVDPGWYRLLESKSQMYTTITRVHQITLGKFPAIKDVFLRAHCQGPGSLVFSLTSYTSLQIDCRSILSSNAFRFERSDTIASDEIYEATLQIRGNITWDAIVELPCTAIVHNYIQGN